MAAVDFVNINNKKIPIQDWSFTLFQLCDSLGIKIPRFCYHERLSIAGNCRMCMVEVASSLKPVVACATSLTKGMVVHTNSVLAKRARENVLEFLLINHPLDCPICDQGGECDLQDQAVAYGSDKGRFAEVKRSVEDKYFGPIVKTVMTRCIHCTRCVRFFEEISGTPFLGTMGRGKDTEISSYISVSLLNSNISGNVIDLCPVGALTSKPHAFLYRPWELTSMETVDTTDSLGSNIRVDLKGAEIVRILPKRNDLINEDWISDITRYSYEGLKHNRLSIPMVRTYTTGDFVASGWSSFYSDFLSYYTLHILSNPSSSLLIQLGSSLDLFTVFVASFFTKFFNNVRFMGSFSTYPALLDDRRSYLLSSSLSTIENSDLVVLVNTTFNLHSPVIQARLKKNFNSFLYFGLNGNNSLDGFHIGLSVASSNAFYRGKNAFSALLFSAKNPCFLSSTAFINSSSTCVPALDKILYSSLSSSYAQIHSNEVGLSVALTDRCTSSLYYAIDSSSVVPDFYFDSGSFLVYQGTNAVSTKTYARSGFEHSWYLPSCSSFEFRGFYLNILGYLQLTRKCTTKLGLSLTNSDILVNLFVRIYHKFSFYNKYSSSVLTSTSFYSFFLDFVVVSLDDSVVSTFTSSMCVSLSVGVSSSIYTNSDGVLPSYISYSNTLSNVSKLRSYSTF